MSQSTKPLLIYSDTVRSADLFHAIPLTIGDPFVYAEVDSRKVAVIGVLERDRIEDLGLGIEVIDPILLGQDDLLNSGASRLEIAQELVLRSCQKLGISEASVPADFPLSIADHLRAGGVALTVDSDRFVSRRRAKTAAQLEGMRRAQRAADAAMATAARLIRELPAGLTCEQIRTAMQQTCTEHSANLADDVIVAHGPQSALGHETGFGPIERGETVLVDIWPEDKKSRCFADMSRTFIAGGEAPPEEMSEYWRLCREAMNAVMPEVRPGASCRKLFELACAPFEAAGYPTLLSKKSGEVLDHGFYHGLGHGIGLEVHESPLLSRSNDTLVAGDVITVEPGCYRPGFAGCRLEDLVLVTENGAEIITDFPYDL